MKKEQPFPTTCQAEEAELLTDDGQVEECSGFPNAKSIYLAIKQTNKNKRNVSGGHTPEVYKEMSSGRRGTLEKRLSRDVVAEGTILLLLIAL